jgi:lambda family phage portal protein
VNLIEKAIAAVSPGWALQREVDRKNLSAVSAWSGYEGTSSGRERPYYARWRAMQADEDAHAGPYDRATLLLTLQDLYRNNEVFFGIANRLPDYVVGTGIIPQARTSSRAWNSAAEGWFRQWMKVADYRQRPGFDFVTHQKISIRARLIAGECGFVLLDNGQLQPIEMDRVATPAKLAKEANIRDGIKYDASGLTLGYFILGRQKNGYLDQDKFTFVPRENFVHVMSPWRFDQGHGIPEAASLIGKLSDLREADKYVLLKVKNDAKQFLKKTKSGGAGLLNETPRNARTITDATTGAQQAVESHEWGQVYNLRLGEDVQSFDSRTPNQQYVPYLEFQCKLIGAALGLPWEFILMVFTAGSFSAQRSGLLHALHTFTVWHDWLCRSLCTRVWNWRIAKAIKAGELDPAPADARGVSEWYKVEWSLPSVGWVDPEAMVASDTKAWQLGSRSLKDIAASAGRDRDDVLAEKKSDILEAIAIAAELNQDNPEARVTWRDIINAGQTGALINASAAPQETPPKENP